MNRGIKSEKPSCKMNENISLKLLKNFYCSNCNFQFFVKGLTFKGSRCPMLLYCGHSVCNSCLHKNLRATQSITCVLCGFISQLDSSEQINNCFSVNIYLLGSLIAFQNFKFEKDRRLSFLAKTSSDFNYATLRQSNVVLSADSSDADSDECSPIVSEDCEHCKSNFCAICWSRVQNCAKNLTKYFSTTKVKVSRTILRKCIEHDKQELKFFQEDNLSAVCSHCANQEYQEGHHCIELREKNLEVLNKIKLAVEQTDKISKRMRRTLEEMKLRQDSSGFLESEPFSDLRHQIKSNFSRIHGILQLEEERLLKILSGKSREREKSFRVLQTQLEKQLETIEYLLRKSDFALNRPQNSDLTNLYRQLTEVQNWPCYLISKKSGNQEARVFFDESLIETLRFYCTMDLPSDDILEICSSLDLSEDGAHHFVNVSDLGQSSKEGQESSVSTTNINTLSSSLLREPQKEDFDVPISKEPNVFLERKSYCVRISFIKNPSDFYVTLNSQRAQQNAIDKQASLLGSTISDVPYICKKDEIYLVKHKFVNKWYRGRVTEIFPSERTQDKACVLVYYLDYGNLETVPITRLKAIPPGLLEEPPLAVKCKLFDCVPKNDEWCAESTMAMEKILKNHTATMFVMKVHTDCLEVDLSVIYPEEQIGREIVSVRDALLFLELSSFVHGFKNSPNLTVFKYLLQCLPSVGETFDVIVTHVNSPSDFYVQKTKQDALNLYKLDLDLQNYYEENSEKGMIYNPKLDMPCAALFSEDQRWYRAKIMDIPGKKMVTVFYVDYGNRETVQWTGIRKLKDSFAKYPPFALNCKLAGILPTNGEPWSTQAISYMKKKILLKRGRIFIEGKFESRQQLEVLLYKKENKKNFCLNALFVSMGFAINSSSSDLLIFKAEKEEKDNLALRSDKSSSENEVEKHQSVSCNETDILRMRGAFKKRRNDDSVLKGVRELQGYEKQNSFKNPFSNNYEKDKTDEDRNIFKIKVNVLLVESPSSIYVTFMDLIEELENLQAKLDEFYKDSINSIQEWTIGSMCAVFDSAKRCWHRGSVLDILPNDRVQVFLKDVARVSSEPVSALRVLDPSFQRYSACAIKCHLADIKPPGAQWPSISSEFLSQELENHKDVYLSKRGETENGSLPVELWIEKLISRGALLPCKKNWVTLNRMLVNQGLAIPMKINMWDKREILVENKVYLGDENSPNNNQTPSLSSSFSSDKDFMKMSKIPENFVPSFGSGWIPPLPLRHSRFIGRPTFVDFNAFIYMYDTEQDEEKLKKIRETLLEEFGNSKPSAEDNFWIPGQSCIARYHVDNSWYRGLILRGNEDKTYDVLFVDYGNVEICQASDLRKRIKMHDIPILTHKFQLQGIETVSDDGKWPVTVIDYLHALVVDRNCDVNILKYPLNPNEAYIISLKVIENDIEVGTFLVNKNLAFLNSSGIEITPDNDFFLFSSEFDLGVSRYNRLVIPRDCSEFFIEVTTVCSETEFFANIVVDESLPSILKKDLSEFRNLQNELTEKCYLQSQVEKLFEGHPCCCMDFKNNKWCRGEIKSYIRSKNLVCVHYVDCGKTEFLHKDHLRECKKDWLNLPKMAVKFKLRDVKKNVNISETIYRKTLIDCLTVKSLFAKILNKHEHLLEVQLFTKKNGPLAYQEMIDKGLMNFIS